MTWIALQGHRAQRLPIFKIRQDTSVTYHIPFAMTTKIQLKLYSVMIKCFGYLCVDGGDIAFMLSA